MLWAQFPIYVLGSKRGNRTAYGERHYLAFFNLRRTLPDLPPDPFYFYPAERLNVILSSLNFAIEQLGGRLLATARRDKGKPHSESLHRQLERSRGNRLIMTPA
jgi:hypothetical protein